MTALLILLFPAAFFGGVGSLMYSGLKFEETHGHHASSETSAERELVNA